MAITPIWQKQPPREVQPSKDWWDWLSRKVESGPQKKPFWERPVGEVISEFFRLETPWGKTTTGEPKPETEAGRLYLLEKRLEEQYGKSTMTPTQQEQIIQTGLSSAEQYQKYSSWIGQKVTEPFRKGKPYEELPEWQKMVAEMAEPIMFIVPGGKAEQPAKNLIVQLIKQGKNIPEIMATLAKKKVVGIEAERVVNEVFENFGRYFKPKEQAKMASDILKRVGTTAEFGMKGADIGVQKDIFGATKVVRTTPSGTVEEILPTMVRGKGEQLGLGERLVEAPVVPPVEAQRAIKAGEVAVPPTTAKYPQIFDRSTEELLGKIDDLSYEELRHYQARLGNILRKGMKGVEEKWSGKYQQIADLWEEFNTALKTKEYGLQKAEAIEEAGRLLRGGLQDRTKAVWNDLSWRNYIIRGDFPEAVSVDTFKKWNGGRAPSSTSIIQKGLNKGKVPTEIAADDMLSELGYHGTVTQNAIDQLQDDFYMLHKLYLEQGGKRVETVVTKGPRTANIPKGIEPKGAEVAPRVGEMAKPAVTRGEAVPQATRGVAGQAPKYPWQELPGETLTEVKEPPGVKLKPSIGLGVTPPPPKKPLHTAQQFDAFWKRTREGKPKVPLSQRLKEGYLTFEKQVVDEAAKLNKLGKSVEESLALFRGMSRKAQSIYNETFDTIRITLGKGNEKLLDEVDKYLFLKHNIEVIKMKGALRPYVTLDGVRYTAQDLGWRLGEMEQKIGTPLYQKVKQAAEAIPAAYNKLLKESSELPADVVNDLIQKYPYYNPLIYDTESSFVKKGVKRLGRTIQELSEVAPADTPKSPLSVLGREIAYRVKNNAENVVRRNISDALVTKGGGKIVDKQPTGAFVDFFSKGEKVYLELTDEYKWVAKELGFFNYDPGLITKVTRIGQMINALPRAFYTTLSPVFMMRNLAVDGLTAYLHEGLTPIWYLKGLRRTLINIVKTDPVFMKMEQAGGGMGGFTKEVGTDIWVKMTKINVGKVIEIRNPKDWKRLLKPWTLMEELGYAVEQAPRLGLFERVLKAGGRPEEAAFRARRVTIDFARMGEFGRLVNGWYLFANASKEGLLLPFRAMISKPMARVRIAGFSSLLIGTYAWNRSFPEYEQVPDQIKYGSWVIMLPSDRYDKFGEKLPNYIRMTPMLREWGMFAAPFVYLLRKLEGKNPEEFGTFLRTYATVFSPMSNFLGGEGTIFVPTELGQTMTDISYNFDSYRNRPIVDDDLLTKPKPEQYDEYTSGTAIKLGHILNQSPKIIDYFMNNMTGTLGRELIIALDRGIKQIDSSDTDPRIVGLVDQLRDIQVQYKNNPEQIPGVREKFLNKLPFDERQAVLSRERMPEDKIPIFNGIVSSFFRNIGNTGGQVFRTEKAKIAPELKQFKYDAADVFDKYYDQKEGNARANYRTKNPETDAILFLYGKVTTFKTTRAKDIATKYYEKYGKFDYEMQDPNEKKPTTTPITTPSWTPEREKVPVPSNIYTPGYLPRKQTTPTAPGAAPKRELPTLE